MNSLKRILVISPQHVSTHEASDYKLTNTYLCSEIRDFFPITTEEESNTITTGADQLFTIIFPGNKMKFKSKYRAEILTDLFKSCKYSTKYAESALQYVACKHTWANHKREIVLDVNVFAVRKLDKSSGRLLSTYLYKDIYNLYVVKDYDQGYAFIISTTEQEKLHLFSVTSDSLRKDIMDKIRTLARRNIGTVIPISNEVYTMDKFLALRHGTSDVSIVTPLYSFPVQKEYEYQASISSLKKRCLLVTETLLLERDTSCNEIVNVRHLNQIYSLVRPKNTSQLFAVQYLNGDVRMYTTTERDELLASLLDCIRTSGNVNVQVKLDRFHHWILPYYQMEPVRYLYARYREVGSQLIDLYNEDSYYSCCSPQLGSGDVKKDVERCIVSVISELLSAETNSLSDEQFNNTLIALKYLFSTKPGFCYFVSDRKWRDKEIEALFVKVKNALVRDNDVIIFNVIDVLSTLMQVKAFHILLCSHVFLPLHSAMLRGE